MAQVGRISGPLLQADLLRNGNNLAFRNDLDTTQLLLLDVNTGRIGVNTSTSNFDLEVIGTTQTTNLISNDGATTPGFIISNSTFSAIGDISLNAAEAVVMANLDNGTIRISDNTIRTMDSNADIDLTPNGVGTTEVINDLNVFGSIYTPGNITFDGTLTLGDQDTDTVSFNSDITSNIVPDQRNTYNLGSVDKQWRYLYTNFINGTEASTDELNVGAVDIKLRYGGTLYVAQEGNDTNSGDHMLSPFATLARALQAAEASGTQPVTIKIAPGEYQETLPLVVPENVTIIGADIRNVIIVPDTNSQSEDVFHLNDNTTISDITIKNYYYDSINNTGYAFRFAAGAVMTTRSPYIQNITVLTQETSEGAGDAGRGAWIDGAELNAASINATMLFHSCTFISPGADVINMTNGVRVEWLNSFTYYANRGLYAFNGVTGRTSYDGSTVEYGAELRSIGSANVYGTYGAVADGADTLMYLIQHNFGYIGSGLDNSNDITNRIQANEVVELNSGTIHYVSTDHEGDFRVGDNFYIDLQTGQTSLNISEIAVDSESGILIPGPDNDTRITSTRIEVSNIRFTQNNLDSLIGDLNFVGGSGVINLNSNTTVPGNLDIRDNFSFGGTLNLAGDQTLDDRLTFNVEFEQDFNPHSTLSFDLGELSRQWLAGYFDKLEVVDITFDDNFITSSRSNSDLELRASGTGLIFIPSNNVQIDNNLTVSSNTNLQNTIILGTLTHTGNVNQTGDVTITGSATVTNDIDINSQVQLEEILFDGNVITSTTSNSDLELRANGTGRILVTQDTVQINNNLNVGNIFNNKNINITLQTEFEEADVSDITITQNYITTVTSNANLELRASGTGLINVESNVSVLNNLSVDGLTRLENDLTTYEYGPELVVNNTFDNNLAGWSQAGGGTATASNGNLRINATGAARNVSQEITVEVGKTYDFEAQFRSVSNGNPFYLRIFESGVGTLQEWNETSGLVADQELTFSFVPQTTAIDIIFRAVDTIVEWDNVSMFEDIGFVTSYTPVQVDITGTVTQTGNTVQAGNILQTGDTDINGNLSVTNEVTTTNFNFNDNVLRNVREDLRLNPSDPYGTFSLPQIVKAMQQDSATEADYVDQTEKNLVTFLRNGTSVPYANSYVDVDSSGTVTSSDALAWLQYVANGTTGDSSKDSFIFNVVELLLEDEFANPGKYNSDIFLGDYYRADFILKASGTGRVVVPANDVRITKDLFAASISASDINITRDLDLNEIIITDSIIEIDDNFISTTISNADLDLRSERNVIVPANSVTIDNALTINSSTDMDNLSIVGNITQTGNRTQIGDLSVIGNVTVSTSNIKSEIQFDDIVFNDNYIETTNSNANLELRANGVGILNIPSNDVRIRDNVTLGTLSASTININNALAAETFELSDNIKLFDNVITTTNTNSNLELRSLDSNVRIENIYFKDNDFRTTVSNINISATDNVIINSTAALKIPTGSTSQRNLTSNNIRFNTTDNVFEAFNNSKPITFNGIYSSNRNTSVLADPTTDVLNFTIDSILVTSIDSTGISTHGLAVDDISIQNNIIKTTVSNSDLELRANGTGVLRLDDIDISLNTLQNKTDGVMTIRNTNYGKIKFADTNAVRLPAGSDAERPSFTPEVGMMRWNTTSTILETWDGNTFITAAGSAATISAAEMDDLILEYTLIFG